MTTFSEAIVLVHHRLTEAAIPFAFGGAIALLFCTGTPRTTADLDVNVFVAPEEVDRVLHALEPDVVADRATRVLLRRDGQARLRCDGTAVDLFCSTGPFHDEVETRVVHHELFGLQLPFLSCDDLAIFKAFFNRRKDWADLEAMVVTDSIDPATVTATLTAHLGADDDRIATFTDLVDEVRGGRP